MQTVGTILRTAREQKKLSIKDIEAATSIRALYIQAIEEDNYKVIPGEVYLKGFIRNYAEQLGLNGQEIMNVYRQSLLPSAEEQPAISKALPVAETPRRERAVSRKPNAYGKWILLGSLLFCVVGAAVWYFDDYQSVPAPIQEAKPGTPAAMPVPSQQAPTGAPSAAVAGKVVVVAKFIAPCWTLVIADGKTIYQGIPPVGTSLTWEAAKTIRVRLGNAAGAEIEVDGSSVGALGGKDEVVEKLFTVKQS